ncbi:hypothetical protein SLA_5733 [Streptomyces laurentii]|uniref:EcsC protein family protein n=1 Tax=Streptomyces laurentii TaxID=39478 RepID=A0A169P684_STRLU|nr:hypothetical protein SLA_5733 [Streptomyces laurentii]
MFRSTPDGDAPQGADPQDTGPRGEAPERDVPGPDRDGPPSDSADRDGAERDEGDRSGDARKRGVLQRVTSDARKRVANPARVRLDRLRIDSARIEAVRRGVQRGGQGAKAGLGYLADRVIDIAPRVPVRDLQTLRRQFPGLGPEQIADKLVNGAARASATVGAGVGAAAMLPVPPALPAELATEITGVAAIELKLIAELHELYGVRPPGTLTQRSTAYLTSWSEERGLDPGNLATSLTTVNAAFGGQLKRELRQQIMRRTVRNVPNLTPFLVGAAVGAVMNRRDTRKLAARIRKDLRERQVPWDRLAALPPLEQSKRPELPEAIDFDIEDF